MAAPLPEHDDESLDALVLVGGAERFAPHAACSETGLFRVPFAHVVSCADMRHVSYVRGQSTSAVYEALLQREIPNRDAEFNCGRSFLAADRPDLAEEIFRRASRSLLPAIAKHTHKILCAVGTPGNCLH